MPEKALPEVTPEDPRDYCEKAMLSPTLVVSFLLNVLIYFSFYDTDMILLIVTDLLLYFEKIIFERRGLVELQFFQQIVIDHLLCAGHFLRF